MITTSGIQVFGYVIHGSTCYLGLCSGLNIRLIATFFQFGSFKHSVGQGPFPSLTYSSIMSHFSHLSFSTSMYKKMSSHKLCTCHHNYKDSWKLNNVMKLEEQLLRLNLTYSNYVFVIEDRIIIREK